MSNEFDSKLSRLFAERSESLDAAPFVAEVMIEIARAARARSRRRLLIWALAPLAVGAICVLFPAGAVLAVRTVGELSSATASLMVTPLGWGVSSIAGVWLLLRLRTS
jgi:hypothetical protein